MVDLVAGAGPLSRSEEEVAEEAAPVRADDRVVAEDQAGGLVDLAGVAARVVVEEVVFDDDVAEGALLEEQGLVGFGVAGDVVGEADVVAAAEDLPEVLVVAVAGSSRLGPRKVLWSTVKSTGEADWM